MTATELELMLNRLVGDLLLFSWSDDFHVYLVANGSTNYHTVWRFVRKYFHLYNIEVDWDC